MTKSERNVRDREIFIERQSGVRVNAICEKHGLGRTQVHKILQSQGFSRARESEERNKRILVLHIAGKTAGAIANELVVPYSTVRSWLVRHGYGWIPKKVECVVCCTLFLQKTVEHKLCSDKCRKLYKDALQVEKDKLGYWKRCEHCDGKYKVYGPRRYRQRFCSVSCARKHRHRDNVQRDKDIFLTRYIQGIPFTMIGELFGISAGRCQEIYKEQLVKRNMERG